VYLTKLKKLAKYIESYQVTQFEQNGNNLRLKLTVNFKDTSKLFIKEIIINGEKRKYGYQWVDKDYVLICRWDNAPDWPSIETFPHHKHDGEENNVKPSENIEFSSILDEIIQRMIK